MSSPAVSPLEVVRRKESEVKRRLAAEREAAEAALAEAERRALDVLAQAEITGQHTGTAQRETIRAEAERDAEAIVTQARAETETLQRVGANQLEALITRAIQIVIGGPHAP